MLISGYLVPLDALIRKLGEQTHAVLTSGEEVIFPQVHTNKLFDSESISILMQILV
jgi:hypothetical protein